MSSINDFILEIENHSAHNTNASAPSSPKRKRIPRVPQELLSMKDSQEYFEPAVISLGPYYHGNSKYERMEPVKRNIVRQFFVKWRAPIKDIYDKIHNQIKEVRDYYEEQSTDRVADEELTFMMLIDGALLFVCLLYPSSFYPEVTVTERKSFLRDLVLLENQIPFMVIKVFVESIRGLNRRLLSFGCCSFNISFPVSKWGSEMGTAVDHLLHKLQLAQRSTAGDGKANKPGLFELFRNNVREIVAKGIHLKPGRPGIFDSVSFSSGCIYGELIMPPLFMDEFTLQHLSNLIAYEKSQGDNNCQYVVTSYINFLDSLIDGVEDILELQSAGIVSFSKLSPHEEEHLFNFVKEIASPLVPCSGNYHLVSEMIKGHMETKWKTKIGTWVTEVRMVYFRSPWSGIAVLAGFVLFFLAATQIYFTVFPR